MNTTTPRGYPLPHPDNLLAEDVLRIRAAITAIDADVLIQSTRISERAALVAAALRRQHLRVFHQLNF